MEDTLDILFIHDIVDLFVSFFIDKMRMEFPAIENTRGRANFCEVIAAADAS